MRRIALRFWNHVINTKEGVPVQVQLRAPIPVIVGVVRVVDNECLRGVDSAAADFGGVIYEIEAQAMEAGRLLSIKMTVAGEDVVWFATAPTLVEKPSILSAGGSIVVGGRS